MGNVRVLMRLSPSSKTAQPIDRFKTKTKNFWRMSARKQAFLLRTHLQTFGHCTIVPSVRSDSLINIRTEKTRIRMGKNV